MFVSCITFNPRSGNYIDFTSAPHHPRAAGNVKWYEDELEAAGQKRDLNNLPPTVNPRPKNDGVEERELYEALCRNEVPVVGLIQ